MKILFDANVVLDLLLKRQGWSESALALAQTPEPWISSLTIANITYILGRSKINRISTPLHYLRSKFRITSFQESSIDLALQLGLNDFEDAAQMAMALENDIPYLVTHNLSDFKTTPQITILSVSELLQKLS
jgi:predicted nucleic acid-binding protein